MNVLPINRLSTVSDREDLLAAAAILRREYATIGRAHLLEMAANHHPADAAADCGGGCVAVQAARRVLARQQPADATSTTTSPAVAA